MTDLGFVAAAFGPLFLGLVVHGICIKRVWLAGLRVPIDRGMRVRGRALFGANKTVRGVVAVALGAAAGYGLQGLWPEWQLPALRHLPALPLVALGGLVGAAAMASELANSFVKRQLDIAPGAPGRGVGAAVFYVVDQVAFLLGAWLVLWPWIAPSPARIVWSIGFVLVVHQVISSIGARLGMRASPR
jgi:hypothetical protein